LAVIGFVLDSTSALNLDRAVRRDYDSVIKRSGTGYSIEDPPARKQIEGRAERARVRQMCSRWLADHLHGTFAADGPSWNHPCVELITANSGMLLGTESEKLWSPMRLFSMDAWDIWESAGKPTVRLCIADERDAGAQLIAQTDRQAAIAEATEHGYSVPEPSELLETPLSALTAVWGVDQYLRRHQQRLSQARDRLLVGGKQTSTRAALKRLGELHDVVLSDSGDLRVVSADLTEVADDRYFGHEALDPKPMKPDWQGEDSFLTGLRRGIAARTARLLAREDDLRSLLVADGTTKGAIANMKLQRRLALWAVIVGLLTVALVFLAAATLYVAANQGSQH
jgi:hypothetical protein